MKMPQIHIVVILLVSLFFSVNSYSSDSSVNEKDGLLQISGATGMLVASRYVGWVKGWKWDAPKASKLKLKGDSASYNLLFKKQGVNASVDISRLNNSINYDYLFKYNKNITKTVGGGIEFFLDLDVQKKINKASDPELLPDNSGWSWEYKPGKKIVVSFTQPVSRVHFERGKKSHIRVLFFHKAIAKGSNKIAMTISLPKELLPGSLVSDKSKLSAKWLQDNVSLDNSVVDLSYLNHTPAGKNGFITAKGDGLFFENGEPARFFGTNVQAYSLFPVSKKKNKKKHILKNKGLIAQHAKRIAKLGFNLVRLHHHDSIWLKHSLIEPGNTTQQINEESLDLYFWWVKCLRDQGVYVWVDLQVQRPWKEGDNIPGWATDMAPKARKGMNVGKGFIYLNQRMQELTKKFNKELITRVNPYTGLALREDPAVAAMMITNENDLTFHFGNKFLKNKKHPYHQRLFDEKVETFSSKHSLNPRKVRKTWVPGQSKYLLNDIEADFNSDMIRHLRDLGVKVPIITTNIWGRNKSLFSLPALTQGDVIDAHGYAGSSLLRKSALQKDPRVESNFLHNLGMSQVVDKPFSISEYNAGLKNDEEGAFTAAVLVPSMAAFQGWDAIMLYGYSQDGLKGGKASPWSSYTHPAIIGVSPAMALLYRNLHVSPAKKSIVLAPSSKELFEKLLSPKTSLAMRTLMEQHKLSVAIPREEMLPWLKGSKIEGNTKILTDFNKNMLTTSGDFVVSDTSELRRNWLKGHYTIDTKRTQLAMGKIGGDTIKLSDVIIEAETPEVAIIVTSLDDKPLKQSEKILVTAVARVSKIRNKWKKHYVSEPVNASIMLQSFHDSLNITPVRADGTLLSPRKLEKSENNNFSITLSENDRTHWYIISR